MSGTGTNLVHKQSDTKPFSESLKSIRQEVDPGAGDQYTATAVVGLKSKHPQSQQEQHPQVFGMTSPK